MKILKYGIVSLSVAIGFSACGSTTWLNLDKTQASKEKIQKAKKICEYNEKEKASIKRQDELAYSIFVTGIEGKRKKEIEEQNKEEELQVYIKLDECMEDNGLIEKNKLALGSSSKKSEKKMEKKNEEQLEKQSKEIQNINKTNDMLIKEIEELKLLIKSKEAK